MRCFQKGTAVLFLLVWICTACTRPVSTMPAVIPSTAMPQTIDIVRVRVTQETGVYVLGATSLPDGNCIRTELLADQKPEDWWPADICVEVDSGQWEILVPLGRRSAPLELKEAVEYVVHAWWPENPQATSIYFPFDLSGPGE